MTKVRVYGKKEQLEDFFALLRKTELLHVCKVSRRSLESFDESEILTGLQADEATHEKNEKQLNEKRLIEEAAEILEVNLELDAEGTTRYVAKDSLISDLEIMRELCAELEELKEELVVARRYRRLCKVFSPILNEIGDIKRVKALGVTIDTRYREEVLPAIRQKLDHITGGGYQMLWRKLDYESVGVVILFPPSYAKEVSTLLNEKNIFEIRLPHRYEGLSLLSALGFIEKRLEEIPAREQEIERALKDMKERYAGYLVSRWKEFSTERENSELAQMMACTRFLFICEGYLPVRSLYSFEEEVQKALGEGAKVVEMDIPPEEIKDVPVAFKNYFFFKPFERVLSFLPIPRYGTIDPTPIIALTFPLFFGIILGDIGYGATLLLASLIIRRAYRKRPLGRDISSLLGIVAVFSIFFGFVYGELFGDLGHKVGLKPLWRGRIESASVLLIFSVSIGVSHVILSFLMAVFQNLKNRSSKQVWVALISLGALTAIFLSLVIISGYLPADAWAWVLTLLIACIAMLIYLGGLVAALELVSAVGNMLSYARLMALGIASAALALVANKLGGAMGNVVAAVAVVIILHGINLVLGVFSPTLHGLRLHFVEFLPRFYKYGGKAYSPFGKGK